MYKFIAMPRNKNILKLVLFATSIVSAVYFVGMITSHVKHQLKIHFIWNCFTRDNSNTETLPAIFCHGILGMLIIKAIILPAALLIKLIIAIHTTRAFKAPRSKHSCATHGKVLALW